MKKHTTKHITPLLLTVVLLSIALFIYTKGTLGKRVEIKELSSVQATKISYTCAHAIKIVAQYDNTDKNNPKAIISFGNMTNRVMKTVQSASGAKYSDGAYIWWTKGDTAFLAEATKEEKILATDCVANK